MEWCKRCGAAFQPGHRCPKTPQPQKPGPKRTTTDEDNKQRNREYARRYRSTHKVSLGNRKSKRRYPPQYCIICGKQIQSPGNSGDKKARFCSDHNRKYYHMFRYYVKHRQGKPLLSPEEAEKLIVERFNREQQKVRMAGQRHLEQGTQAPADEGQGAASSS